MASYITSVTRILEQAEPLVELSEPEVKDAIHTLSQSPVLGFPAFTPAEVSLLGIYRRFVSQGALDVVWQGMVAGDWNAWPYAIHEAAELQAFFDLEVDVFDCVEYGRMLWEAHVQATLVELQFLSTWAEQREWRTSKLALEMQNPMRKQFPFAHQKLLDALSEQEGWMPPTPAFLEDARAFWQAIRIGVRA